ncbi:GTPase IMAP family member 4-like [Haliotis cracherodii]|uniref:GTPase IMAP family member 4-like n=1 Tax=Haliotis cracherodii TaxID=6455 RepID=UPI0039ED2423
MDGEWICGHCTLENDGLMQKCKACSSPKPRQEPSLLADPEPNLCKTGTSDLCPTNERRIVILGRTGSGKSATGNNILGKEVFESSACGESLTKRCQRGTSNRFERNIQIIDSPGLFDTGMTNAEITKEVVKCIGMTAPGPHAFVLVVRIDRFTQEEQDTVDHFRLVFGEDMLDYVIVLFTRKDDLLHDNKCIMEYVKKVPKPLRDLLKSCQDRYVAFNNRGTDEEKEQDVQDFLALVEDVVNDNGGMCYTNEMYKEAEKNMRMRERQLKREHECRIQQERDAIWREFELKLQIEHDAASEVRKQLESRIAELESKQDAGAMAEDEIADLCREVEDLKLALRDVKKQKVESEGQLDMERKRRDNEIRKRLKTEKQDFRETARNEVNNEKSGIMAMLGNVLPNLIGTVLPRIKTFFKGLFNM